MDVDNGTIGGIGSIEVMVVAETAGEITLSASDTLLVYKTQ